jgi:CheY-like chemotaxis protein
MGRVLIIEDDSGVAHVYRLLLEGRGHEVLVAQDGSRGLALAQRQSPDVIVLDLMMPVMDGFGTLEGLAETARTSDIPVLVVTAMPEEHVEQRCYSLGAAGYIRKPFDADILIGTVEELLHRRIEDARHEAI